MCHVIPDGIGVPGRQAVYLHTDVTRVLAWQRPSASRSPLRQVPAYREYRNHALTIQSILADNRLRAANAPLRQRRDASAGRRGNDPWDRDTLETGLVYDSINYYDRLCYDACHHYLRPCE